jgi:hypothetical protein
MGLRRKKSKSKKPKQQVSDYKLPELPDLPEFPSVASPPESSALKENEALPQLPSFPNNTVGKKFSQESIKDAVSGKKEVVKEEDDADDFTLPGLPEAPKTMHEPLVHEPTLRPMVVKPSDEVRTKPRVKEFHREVDHMTAMSEMMEPEEKPFTPERHASSRVRSGASARNEPVFIRIDKFEESLKVFEKTREQVKEIEELVRDAKELKAKEEEELMKWEIEIQTIKEQIGKVDRDIFSKVE